MLVTLKNYFKNKEYLYDRPKSEIQGEEIVEAASYWNSCT